MKPSTVLKKARKLIERGWCRFHYALDADKQPVNINSKHACAFCAAGAIERASRGMWSMEARRFLYRATDLPIESWNDTWASGKRDVIRAFDRAIKLALAEGQ